MGLLSIPDERRGSARRPLSAAGITAVKVGGDEVRGIDVSRDGILVESPYRLRPGTETQVHLAATDRPVQVRGRVVRCHVAALDAAGLRYRIAIAFNAPATLGESSPAFDAVAAVTTPPSIFESVIGDVALAAHDPACDLNQW